VDKRYAKLKKGLEQLTAIELQRIIDTNPDKMICDTWYYNDNRW